MQSIISLVVAFLASASAQRVLHWVIRVSDLSDTVAFTTDVLGMKVLRHEENAEPCPLTCNGVFDTPWSKTMVGYGPEDNSYALELTYNYGIDSYEKGGGLQRFIIQIKDAKSALEKAKTRGHEVVGNRIVGPDQYVYELVESPTAGSAGDPFDAVVLKAANPAATAKWYVDMLGMTSTPTGVGSYSVGFAAAADGSTAVNAKFVIEPTGTGAAPKIEQWEGRNAIALPEAAVRAINDRIVKESPELIIHTMRELHEKLGTLFILSTPPANPAVPCRRSPVPLPLRRSLQGPFAACTSTSCGPASCFSTDRVCACVPAPCAPHILLVTCYSPARPRRLRDVPGLRRDLRPVCAGGDQLCGARLGRPQRDPRARAGAPHARRGAEADV